MSTSPRSPANEAVVRRLFEDMFNGRKPALVDEVFGDDFAYYFHMSDKPYRQRQVVLQIYQAFANGFPDFRFEIVDLLADDTKGLCRMYWRGTNTGSWGAEAAPGIESLPPTGLESLPPTGRKVELEIAYAFTFGKGKITSARLIVDPAQMLVQLGVVPGGKTLPRPVVWVAKVRQRLGLLERHRG